MPASVGECLEGLLYVSQQLTFACLVMLGR